MRLFLSFRAIQPLALSEVEGEAESRNLLFNRFLHFGLLRNPTVEMTKAQVLITFGIIGIDACEVRVNYETPEFVVVRNVG